MRETSTKAIFWCSQPWVPPTGKPASTFRRGIFDAETSRWFFLGSLRVVFSFSFQGRWGQSLAANLHPISAVGEKRRPILLIEPKFNAFGNPAGICTEAFAVACKASWIHCSREPSGICTASEVILWWSSDGGWLQAPSLDTLPGSHSFSCL